MKKKGYIPAYSKHFGYISYGYIALQLFIYMSAKYSANFKLSPNLRTRKSNTTKLYYYDNNYYFVIPILFYVYQRFHSHYMFIRYCMLKKMLFLLSYYDIEIKSQTTMSVHVDRVHELCPCGQSSCALSMWTKFMNSIHICVKTKFKWTK